MSATSEHEFMTPVRRIKNVEQMADWAKSQAQQDLLGFVTSVNDAVKSKKISQQGDESEACKKLNTMLETLDGWIGEIPPTDHPQRFGNKAFRDWFDRLDTNATTLIVDVLPSELHPAATELRSYLVDSFGNRTRIDYGSGHELNYAVFLCCLYKLQVLCEKDSIVVAFGVFTRYLKLCRRLQTVYRMEPAGSQGVWGLDDFQFLPYLWGSSQLVGHSDISPSNSADPRVAEMNRRENMYMECINYIYMNKTGPFAEHSPTLWSMTDVQLWQKINSGLIKMYKGEVLGKFPVMQHLVFGTIMTFDPAT